MPGRTTARKNPTPAPSDGPRPGPAGEWPTLDTSALQVSAQGAIYKDDDRVIVAVRVLDADGKPVTGLKEANFGWWQLGHFFSELSGFFVVELADIDGLQGLYHLVRKEWSMVGNGTIPFYVRAAKGARSGGALTFIVKVREGLDNA